MGLREDAFDLASKGYSVFPLAVGRAVDGRKLLEFPAGGWKENSTTDPSVIMDWPWGDANYVGINCEQSMIVVADLNKYVDDTDEDDSQWYEVEGQELVDLYNELAGGDDDAVALPTVGGGVHVLYQANPDRPMASSVRVVAHFVDIRAEGGIILAHDPDNMPPVSDLHLVPGWLVDLNVSDTATTPKSPPREPRYLPDHNGTPYGLGALKNELERISRTWDLDNGTFNHTLNASAFALGQLVAGGELDGDHTHTAISNLLTELGADSGQFKTLDSGFSSGYDRPRSAVDPNADPDSDITPSLIASFADEVVDRHGIKSLTPPEWLLAGWLERNSVAQLIGPPGEGKTWVGLDMAACVSRGLSWPEKREGSYRPEVVFWVAAEGAHGVGTRITAWEVRNGDVGGMLFLPRALQIISQGHASVEWRTMVAYLKSKKPGLIVIDTQARCTVGLDENKAEVMGVVHDQVENLRQQTGACVMLIHHAGKGYKGEMSARGSSAMLGAVTTEIQVSKHGVKNRIKVVNSKQKNAAESDQLWFELADVPNTDSAVLVPSVAPERKAALGLEAKIKKSHYRMKIRETLMESLGGLTNGEIRAQAGLPDRSQVKAALEWFLNEQLVTRSEETSPTNVPQYRWCWIGQTPSS